MFGTYLRAMKAHRLGVWATPREVIRASHGRLRPDVRRSAEHRKARHEFLRTMLRHHRRAQRVAAL